VVSATGHTAPVRSVASAQGALPASRDARLRSQPRRACWSGRAVPTLDSADLGRDVALYAPVGFVHPERRDRYPLLRTGGAVLQETGIPAGCPADQ
jgi:hypothetical protein